MALNRDERGLKLLLIFLKLYELLYYREYSGYEWKNKAFARNIEQGA